MQKSNHVIGMIYIKALQIDSQICLIYIDDWKCYFCVWNIIKIKIANRISKIKQNILLAAIWLGKKTFQTYGSDRLNRYNSISQFVCNDETSLVGFIFCKLQTCFSSILLKFLYDYSVLVICFFLATLKYFNLLKFVNIRELSVNTWAPIVQNLFKCPTP